MSRRAARHRRPHGQFAPAQAGPREEQVGDVGAGDEQDEGHGEQHDPEHPHDVVPEEGLGEPLHLDLLPALPALGLDGRALGGDRTELGRGDLRGHARPQPPNARTATYSSSPTGWSTWHGIQAS